VAAMFAVLLVVQSVTLTSLDSHNCSGLSVTDVENL